MPEDNLYNIVTLKNLDDEDFIFQVDNISYLLKVGELRNFPKFMAKIAVKHLVDKILEKKDHDGKLMANQEARDELAAQIVCGEEQFARPVVPTDQEVLEQMNRPSDIDNALERNKLRLKKEEPIIPLPQPDVGTVTAPIVVTVEVPKTVKTTNSPTEQFEGLKPPTRDEMLAYAKGTLKMDIEDKKTKAAFAKMTDEDLFKELQME